MNIYILSVILIVVFFGVGVLISIASDKIGDYIDEFTSKNKRI